MSACLLAALLGTVLATGCATQPSPPRVTPINATIQLGRIAEKRFLSRVDVQQAPGGYSGVGIGAGGGSWGGGGGVGVGFAVDLNQLLNRRPPVQVDLYEYRVNTLDGATVTVNAPAIAGLETGSCVRVIHSGQREPGIEPSNEC
ncbi:hypothetical protein K6V06_20220 [Cupriavidus sp. AU9028]|nr:hypothetical protein [Cupriavidus sp. AU9028]